jgi:hypothetical protein
MSTRPACLLVAVLGLAACGGDEPRSPAPAGVPGSTAPRAAASPTPTTGPRPPAPRPDVKVLGIDVGAGITAEKTIAKPSTVFAPTDTVYVVVRTEGKTEFSRVSAHWKDPDGSVALMARQNIRGGGPTVTEFHYANPRGLAKGQWNVEIQLDDVPSGTTSFEIR